MNKVVAGVAAAAVIAIGAGIYGTLIYPSQKARTEVEKVFATLPRTMNAHHGGVSYSLFTGTLTIADLSATIEDGSTSANFAIGELSLRGLKDDSIDTATARRITIDDKSENLRITADEFRADEVVKGQQVLFSYNEDGREWAVPSIDFRQASLNGTTITNNGESVNVREIAVSDLVRKGTAVTGLTLGIHGLAMDVKDLPDDEARTTFSDLGYEKLSLNFDLSFSHSIAAKRLSIRNAAFGVDNAGRLALSADIGEIPELANEDPMAALAVAMNATLEKMELRYEDASLADRVLKAAAKEEGMDEAAMKAQVIAGLKEQRESPTLSPLSRSALDSALTFVESPKSLVIKASPRQPVPLAMLMMGASQNPDQFANSLNLSVSANK